MTVWDMELWRVWWRVISRLLVSSSRLKEFKSSLFAVFQSAHAQSVKMNTLMDDINKEREKRFSEPEVRSALRRMQDDNQVMVADDIIFLIWGRRGRRLFDVTDSERSAGLFSHVQTGRLIWIQLLMDLDPLLCLLFISSRETVPFKSVLLRSCCFWCPYICMRADLLV